MKLCLKTWKIKICLNKKINSVAFPLIGAGTGGIRKELVIKFIIDDFPTFGNPTIPISDRVKEKHKK